MLFSPVAQLADNATIVHIHVPRTGGTSLRLLLNQAFGTNRCLMNYQGEIEGLTPRDLAGLRCISGHIPYGVHRHLAGPASYITVLRHPIDRYVSTYAEFLGNPKSRHHALASAHDINSFLREALNSGQPALRQQMHNLQCRLVCGDGSFAHAKDFIDERYFLAAPYPELNAMADLLAHALKVTPATVPHVHDSEALRAAHPDRFRLNEESIELLLDSEAEDLLLYSHVQKTFTKVLQSNAPVASATSRAREPRNDLLPPKDLRFMGETDEVFVSHADYLAKRVVGFAATILGGAAPERLLDIGCGYGRLAYGLRRLGFNGSYTGFDILKRHIEWLNEHFVADAGDARYRFDHANIYNERYNPSGLKLDGQLDALPLHYAPASFDTLVSLSVFTHLYEEEVVRYIRDLGRLLQEGGLWVTTFFSMPPGFSMDAQPDDATFRLVKQVSAHGYIHSLEEPLYVIAYPESFLQRLFATHGLEVVAQRKGRWNTTEHAVELQDWFVLRKRSGWRPVSPQPRPASHPEPVPQQAACNVCGGHRFGPGPNGRLSGDGHPPRCLQCDALERHRIVRRVLGALPAEFLAGRRALQFSPDQGLDPRWFGSMETSIYEGENSLDIQHINRPDASYDFLSLSHVLESVPDDRAGFNELCRILSPRGLMHISFGRSQDRDTTQDLAQPLHAWKAWHLYGRDLAQRFGCAEKGLSVIVAEATDPCTGVRETVHLFLKHSDDAKRVRSWLNAAGESIRLL